MEIIVTGKANEYFKPDQIILNINFYVKENTYEDVLIKGTNNVKIFIDEVLINNGFKNDDLKTRSFIIKEEKNMIISLIIIFLMVFHIIKRLV